MSGAGARAPARVMPSGSTQSLGAATGVPPGRPVLDAAIVVGTGVVAALNYGKLPPALTALQLEFGLSLLQVSWMVSLFMVGAAAFGMIGGAVADRFGLLRVMVGGLLLMGASSIAGALAEAPAALLASRAGESLGFLLAVLPGPALLRRCVPGASLRGWLGAWSAYMPAGMSVALVVTPFLLATGSWRVAWWISGLVALGWACIVLAGLARRSSIRRAAVEIAPGSTLGATARLTLSRPGPWLIALCFLFYAGQFVGIFSFLPSVYQDAGLAPAMGGVLTALAVVANVSGNLASGLLLQKGCSRQTLVASAGIAMALCAWLAFGAPVPFPLRFAAVVVLSAVGGLIPGTLFATAPYYAPAPTAVSTTVGLMQQGSAWGQILLPPVMAVFAEHAGGWSSIWMATGSAACCTVLIGFAIGRHDRRSGG